MQVIRHNRYPAHNLSDIERAISMASGAWIAWNGLRRGTTMGYLMALAGGELIRRGAIGSCALYSALGISTASRGQGAGTTSVPYEVGIRVDESVIVKRRPDEVYRFWRDLTNLPRILSHVERVEVSGNHSHWTVTGPAGHKLEWDAQIINDVENSLIAWRSLPGAQVDNAGSVHFHPVGADDTRIQVVLQYNPPAGVAGALVAKLWGEEPSQQIRNDLRELKRSLEAAVPIM
jgi:uncharacterized membrane protein